MDCLKLGRRKTRTPSARSPGPIAAPAHSEILDGQLLRCGPNDVMHDLPLPDFAAQLHLRRHKFDRMFLQVDDREEDHDFFAMVDNLAYAGFQDLGAWRHDPRLLAVEHRQRSLPLAFQQSIEASTWVGHWRCQSACPLDARPAGSIVEAGTTAVRSLAPALAPLPAQRRVPRMWFARPDADG